MQIEEKIAIVTGSATGIGESVAQSLPGGATFIAADFADPAQCKALVQTALASFGRLDIPVSSAARSQEQW